MLDTKAIVRAALLIVFTGAAALLAGCGSGGGETPTMENPIVEPMPADSPEMTVETPDGVLPCGIGQVDWGFRVFRMRDFTGCEPYFPDLTVYCLDAEANWSDETVFDLRVSIRDNNVSFNVRQEGICGLFPTED